MDKRLKIIQVVFNLADPFQERLLQHVCKHPNQSGYIKRIVQRDMDGMVMASMQVVERPSREMEFDAEGFI